MGESDLYSSIGILIKLERIGGEIKWVHITDRGGETVVMTWKNFLHLHALSERIVFMETK